MDTKNDPATDFSFVTDDKLRESLQSDYRELCAGMKGQAWKSVHVLAGSMVEALLIDWLDANGITDHKGKALLSLDLGGAVEACDANKLITERAKSLITVVKGYRNLIHPGRIIRTQEVVDEKGAAVAQALVEIIAKDILDTKTKNYGYTAEQIVNKLVNDPSKTSFLRHLLKKTHEKEKERLLVKVIPHQYADIAAVGMVDGTVDTEAVLQSLVKAFREVFAVAQPDTRQKSVAKYISILKDGEDVVRRTYEEAFFVASDMHLCEPSDIELVLDHLLSRLEGALDCEQMYAGIGQYLNETNWKRFVDILLKRFYGGKEVWEVERILRREIHTSMSKALSAPVLKYLRQQQSSFQTWNEDAAAALGRIIENDEIPF